MYIFFIYYYFPGKKVSNDSKGGSLPKHNLKLSPKGYIKKFEAFAKWLLQVTYHVMFIL